MNFLFRARSFVRARPLSFFLPSPFLSLSLFAAAFTQAASGTLRPVHFAHAPGGLITGRVIRLRCNPSVAARRVLAELILPHIARFVEKNWARGIIARENQ